jgi:CubicO group peptidase (beta-lactamase class C family)
MKTIITLLVALILSNANLFSQHERFVRLPLEEELQNDFTTTAVMDTSGLDSIIINTMETYHIPGLSALITTKDNGIIWKRNFGYANVALNHGVEDSTLFLIGSISKTILVTALMQFWEEDSFDLDDNINDYLEDFQVTNPYHSNDTITFRMLLKHTSSINDNWAVLSALALCGDSPIPLDSFLVNYFTPGGVYYNTANFNAWTPSSNTWDYCNVATCILAYIVEELSGVSFDQYCRENIFNPLEMNKTSWFLEGLDTTSVATPYFWTNNQYFPYCHSGFPYYPAGQLRTNKIELEHFLSAYMNWGHYNGETILDSTTIDLILTDHLGYKVSGFGYWGLIWFQAEQLNGRFPWGHTGGWFGCNTGMFLKQDEDWGLICFLNSAPGVSTFFYLANSICDYAQNITEVLEINNVITDYYLEQNYPNPFNPTTTISYSITQRSIVSLKVFDVLGNEVKILIENEKSAGEYEIEFDGRELTSGVYFYQLIAGDYTETKKMVLLK